MKLFSQTPFLVITTVGLVMLSGSPFASWAWADAKNSPASVVNAPKTVSATAAIGCGPHGGVLGTDGIERPANPDNANEMSCVDASNKSESVFWDSEPLAVLSKRPDGECGSSAKRLGNLTSWERGYNQAMSGKRYKVAITTKSGAIHPELMACYEYSHDKYGAAERACCMAGFDRGYGDLQQIIVNSLTQKKPAPDSPDALSCYHSFGEGQVAADKRCAQLGESGSCRYPNIKKDTTHLGCASLGYVAGLSQCPAIKAHSQALKSSLNNGALCDASLPPSRSIAGEVAEPYCAPTTSSASIGLPVDSKDETHPMGN